MLSQLVPLIAALSPTQNVILAIVAMGVGFVTLVSLAGIIVPAWASVCKLRLETALKQQMVDRGMSADEILTVLSGPAPSTNTIDFPCASEVVVESEGEWSPALILKRGDDRYFVHYVGYDLSDNEWVSGARVRFPELVKSSGGFALGRDDPAGVYGENSGAPGERNRRPSIRNCKGQSAIPSEPADVPFKKGVLVQREMRNRDLGDGKSHGNRWVDLSLWCQSRRGRAAASVPPLGLGPWVALGACSERHGALSCTQVVGLSIPEHSTTLCEFSVPADSPPCRLPPLRRVQLAIASTMIAWSRSANFSAGAT